MRKEEILKSKTDEQLQSELKKVNMTSGALIGILIPLLAITIYGLLSAKDKVVNMALLTVAISCSAILPSQFTASKKLKAELASREENR